MPEVPIKSTGSGFVIDPDGVIVTEDHVGENAEKVTVSFEDGKRHSARIVGRDPKTDLALLKIDVDQPLPYVGWGDSDTARVGDWVLAIGNPFGLDTTVTSGIVSGRGRNLHLGSYDDFLQIDADQSRQFRRSHLRPRWQSDRHQHGHLYAEHRLRRDRLRGAGEPRAVGDRAVEGAGKGRARLARCVDPGTHPQTSAEFGLPKAEVGLVADLTTDGPAARAGFALGDVILSVNGQVITKKRYLLRVLAAIPVGQKVEMQVWRQGAEIVLRPVIGEMPASPQPPANAPREVRGPREDVIIGLNLAPLTEARRELLEIPPNIRGVVVLSIDDDSAFLRSGIRPGDVVESINQRPVTSPAEANARLRQALASAQKNVLILINRNGINRYLALPVESKPKGDDDGSCEQMAVERGCGGRSVPLCR
jgi:serine protease Do